jgi:hypothetical protein
MKLKNWAYSLFKPDQVLYNKGFSEVVKTPLIKMLSKSFSPDIIAWSNKVTLIIDAKSGKPQPEEDFNQAKGYLQIPKETLSRFFGHPVNKIEVVLLYFDENLKESELVESLKSKITLEPKVIVWVLDQRTGQIRLFYGSHSDPDLNAILKARLPVSSLPPPEIFIQPDSPILFLAKEVFVRLMQYAYRSRNKTFSLDTIIHELEGQVYAFSQSEAKSKLRKVVAMGTKENLCRSISSNTWELNLIFENPELYLTKLSRILELKPLESFI